MFTRRQHPMFQFHRVSASWRSSALFLLLLLSVSAVQGQVPTLEEAYTITYKDLNSSIQPVIGEDSIVIADPTAMGTLKIVKKKGRETYPTIRAIATSGTLTQVLTQGRVETMRVTGDLVSLTATRAYVGTIRAREVGTVKMADYARSHSTWGSEVFKTSIYSISSLPAVRKAGEPTLSARKLQVNLSGVSLVECHAPLQQTQIKLASKSWRNTEKAKDLSLAGIPHQNVADFTGNSIIAGHLDLLSVTGGGGYPNYAAISPSYIHCYGLAAGKPSKIIGKCVVYTFTSHYTLGKASPHTFKEVYNGSIFPDSIYSGADRLDIQAIGGDVRAGNEILVQGAIGKITAQLKRLVYKYESHANVSLIGGYYFVPLLQTGTILRSSSLQASAGPNDIGLIKADLGLNWELTWVYENGQNTAVPLAHSDFIIRAGHDGQGKVGVIQSLKAGTKSLGPDILQAGGPFICGTGYAAAPAAIKGGVYDGYFTWNPIE